MLSREAKKRDEGRRDRDAGRSKEGVSLRIEKEGGEVPRLSSKSSFRVRISCRVRLSRIKGKKRNAKRKTEEEERTELR